MAPKVLAPDAVTSAAGSAAAAVVWRLEGRLHVTVIVKSTFAFAQDAAMTRVEPQPILRAEVHHGKHPTRSVQFTSDLVPYLPRPTSSSPDMPTPAPAGSCRRSWCGSRSSTARGRSRS